MVIKRGKFGCPLNSCYISYNIYCLFILPKPSITPKIPLSLTNYIVLLYWEAKNAENVLKKKKNEGKKYRRVWLAVFRALLLN